MEDWEVAIIKNEQHGKQSVVLLGKIVDALPNLATKEDLQAVEQRLCQKSDKSVKSATGIKDKLLWAMTLALIVIAGGATCLKALGA